MRDFISGWKSTLQKNQAKILEGYLQQKKDNGEVDSQDDLNQLAAEMASELQKSLNKPQTSLVSISYNDKIESEIRNYYVDGIYNDLDVLYKELDNIWRTVRSHKKIFNETTIPAFVRQVANLETQLDVYELLAGTGDGFSYVQYNNFKDAANRRTRTEDGNSYFSDPKTGSLVDIEYDALVVPDAQMLILPPIVAPGYGAKKIAGVVVNNDLSSAGAFADSYGGENLENAAKGGSWRYDIVYYFLPSEEVYLTLDINLVGSPKVNYISIAPLTGGLAVLVDNILFSSGANSLGPVSLVNEALLDTPLNTLTSFYFEPISADRITVVFKQPNYSGMTLSAGNLGASVNNGSWYNQISGDSVYINNAQAMGIIPGSYQQDKPGSSGASNLTIKNAPKKLLTKVGQSGQQPYIAGPYTPQIISLAPYQPTLPPEYGNSSVNVFVYEFGASALEVGMSDYARKGIYVSQPTEVTALTRIALRSIEELPILDTNADLKGGSFEYFVHKKDLDIDGNFIQEVSFPILPLGQDSVTTEVLFPDITTQGAWLNFCAILYDGTDYLHDIKVYKNGLELEEGSDWEISGEDKIGRTEIRFTGTQIGGSNLSGLTDVYTASYTPNFLYWQKYNDGARRYDSSTDDEEIYYANTQRTVWYRQDGTIETDIESNSEITTKIMLRNLSRSKTQTPVLRQYRLALGGQTLV